MITRLASDSQVQTPEEYRRLEASLAERQVDMPSGTLPD